MVLVVEGTTVRSTSRALVFVLPVLLLACGGRGRQSEPAPIGEPEEQGRIAAAEEPGRIAAAEAPGAGEEAARSAIEALNAQLAAAYNRKDPDAIGSLFTDDAVFITNEGLSRGRAAIRDRYQRLLATNRNLIFTPFDFRASGDLAVETGRYSVQIARAGVAPYTESGISQRVWERQPSGEWRIRSVIGATPPAP
jgi:uncharacterized protein (TIGR02246 family)